MIIANRKGEFDVVLAINSPSLSFIEGLNEDIVEEIDDDKHTRLSVSQMFSYSIGSHSLNWMKGKMITMKHCSFLTGLQKLFSLFSHEIY